MQRRSFISGSAVGAASMLTLNLVGCGGKSVASTVSIIQGAIIDLRPLFPNQSATFDKIIALATTFNDAWTKGQFDSARTAFDNLDALITQVIADLQINASDKVTWALAALRVALSIIASIIKEQGLQSPVAAAAARRTASKTVDRVNQLADPSVAVGLLKAVSH